MIDQLELIPGTRVIMKDAKYMSAADKEKVLKRWASFLDSGCSKRYFTRALYEHLIYHCSFIAHYDINGFYATYFEEPEDTIHFLSQFDNRNGIPKSIEYGMIYWYIPGLIKKCQAEQKEMDVTRAKLLLAKHGLKVY